LRVGSRRNFVAGVVQNCLEQLPDLGFFIDDENPCYEMSPFRLRATIREQ
jgi:hypothetical protein